MVDAIVLAGGENNKTLRQASAAAYEALIEIEGKPMVWYVVSILAASPLVNRVFVAGPLAELAGCVLPGDPVLLPSGKTMMDTVVAGLRALGHQNKVLVVTADIPLLSGEALADFLGQCAGSEADVYYPIVSRDVVRRRFTAVKRTYVRLKEGVFTGGNVFLVKPAIVESCLDFADQVVTQRKKPLNLCRLLGWSFIIKFLLGRLSLTDITGRLSELLGITGQVVASPYAEIGMDVDKPSDLAMVRNEIARL